MKFIYANGTCALSVHVLLEELKLSYEAVKVGLEDKTVLESYNQKSYVPVLILDGGAVMTEATALLQYLADEHDSAFLPKEPFARAKCIEWLTYISTELHKGAAPLFYQGELPEAYLTSVKEKISNRLQFIEEQMLDQAFLLGNDYTIADMYFLAILRILEHVKIDLRGFREITNFKKNLEANPLIKGVISAEADAELQTEIDDARDGSFYYRESTRIEVGRGQL